MLAEKNEFLEERARFKAEERAAEARASRMIPLERSPTLNPKGLRPTSHKRVPVVGFLFAWFARLWSRLSMNRIISRRQRLSPPRVPGSKFNPLLPARRREGALVRRAARRFPGYPGRMARGQRPMVLARRRPR